MVPSGMLQADQRFPCIAHTAGSSSLNAASTSNQGILTLRFFAPRALSFAEPAPTRSSSFAEGTQLAAPNRSAGVDSVSTPAPTRSIMVFGVLRAGLVESIALIAVV